MTIKDVLLTLTSYPAPTEARAIETAVAIAGSLGAQISAIAIEMDIQSPIGLYADPVGVRGILAADRKKSADNAHALLNSFETIAASRGIAHHHRLLSCRPLEIPGTFSSTKLGFATLRWCRCGKRMEPSKTSPSNSYSSPGDRF